MDRERSGGYIPGTQRSARKLSAGPAPESQRPTTWSAVLDALYAGSWNADLSRFRSPYAFRGLTRADHVLSSSLVRLAGDADIRRLELALIRNFRKYAHGEAPEC